MDHRCEQCGGNVEQGQAFCPHCRAPQIRVASASDTETAEHPAITEHRVVTAQLSAAAEKAARRKTLVAAVVAGIIAGVVAQGLAKFVSLGILLVLIGAGAIVASIAQNARPGRKLSAGEGAKSGALAGFFAALVPIVQLIIIDSIPSLRAEMHQVMQKAIQEAAARSGDPQAKAVMDAFMSPQGVIALQVALVAILAVGFLIFAALGGALAGVFTPGRSDGSSQQLP
jgi:hypothetical protein